jgi:hypothetical protein
MSYWDGARWVDETVAPARPTSRRANWAATAVMVLGLAALMIPFSGAAAASHKHDPGVTVSCGSGCAVGGSMTVSGYGFTPSAGGQQVLVWIAYPNDYCSGSTCHGFYFWPWVASDGTFSATFTNALLQAGAGGVDALQYNPKTNKWTNVASADYTAN